MESILKKIEYLMIHNLLTAEEHKYLTDIIIGNKNKIVAEKMYCINSKLLNKTEYEAEIRKLIANNELTFNTKFNTMEYEVIKKNLVQVKTGGETKIIFEDSFFKNTEYEVLFPNGEQECYFDEKAIKEDIKNYIETSFKKDGINYTKDDFSVTMKECTEKIVGINFNSEITIEYLDH